MTGYYEKFGTERGYMVEKHMNTQRKIAHRTVAVGIIAALVCFGIAILISSWVAAVQHHLVL